MSPEQQHRSPTEVTPERGWFDEFATRAHRFVARDVFFVAIVVLILAWVPTYFVFHSLDHWYIAFVLPAEILTLLLVILIENQNRRSEQALQRKLNAFAAALAAMADESNSPQVKEQARELRAAIGLEDRESTVED